MSIIELSIHDKWVPSSVSNFIGVIETIVLQIRQGKVILVHCNGGKGRTGLVVAACLVVLGCLPDQAVQIVRAARNGMLRNPAQEAFLHMLKSKLQPEEKSKDPENQIPDRNLNIPGSPQSFLKNYLPFSSGKAHHSVPSKPPKILIM